jgi:deazaflavin-dependent oxidoreductase (nitroreductase family)
VPSDFALKSMNTLHRAVMKLSFGRFGWNAGGMLVVELTTTGRKSGRPRTVLLTSPYQEGNSVVVVASRGGDDQHPAWFVNLRDNPKVDVAMGGKPKTPMIARIASSDERARLWPLVIKDHKNYAEYQTKTEREIPLVLLQPAS